jgi:hypothetical protein
MIVACGQHPDNVTIIENTTPIKVGEATCLPDYKHTEIVDGDGGLGDFKEQLIKCTGVKNITIIHVDVVKGTKIRKGESHQNYLTEAFFERTKKENKERDSNDCNSED